MLRVLATKLNVPATVGDLVVRPLLLDKLDRGLDRKLTLILAPAGYGKTTLVSHWIGLRQARHCSETGAAPETGSVAQSSFRGAWFSVDETDDDLHTFTMYVVAALRSIAPNACKTLAKALDQGSLPQPDRLAVELTHECASLPAKTVRAIDDYHLITNPAVHRFMTQWIRYLPPCLHLVLLARHDPPLGLARLRAEQQVNEFRVRDLQFTLVETRQFFAPTGPAALTDDVVTLLQERMEGWVSGFRLAAISLGETLDVTTFRDNLLTSSPRYIVDYLVDEGLSHQPPAIQSFLLATSVLPRFGAELCAAALGNVPATDCQSILERLEQLNLFLIPLDDHRTWYRYHRQFQSMLQLRLRQRLGQAEIDALHHKAADWLAGQGMISDALSHYLWANDAIAAARLVEGQVAEMLNTERWGELQVWLQRLPAAVRDARPALLLAQAVTLQFRNRYLDIPNLVTEAERLLDLGAGEDSAVPPDVARAWAATMRSFWVPALETTPEMYARAQAGLAGLPVSHDWLRGVAYLAIAMHLQDHGDRQAALNLLWQARQELGARPVLRTRLMFDEGCIHYYGGSLADMWQNAQMLSDTCRETDAQATLRWAFIVQGIVHYHRNEAEPAVVAFEAVRNTPYLAHLLAQFHLAYPLMTLYAERGDSDRPAAVVEDLRRLCHDQQVTVAQPTLDALAAYAAYLMGDLEQAAAWFSTTLLDRPLTEEHVPLILGKIGLATETRGGRRRAIECLTRRIASAEKLHRARYVIEALPMLAAVYWANGDEHLALDALRRALALGYAQGYRCPFTEHGPRMGQMLMALARESQWSQAAGELMGQLTTERPKLRRVQEGDDVIFVEGLTQREKQILELLGLNLSNKEISHSLRISTNTVRNHTVSLYAKLSVSNRGEAIERARRLGLLKL